jgi:hypothetical protein
VTQAQDDEEVPFRIADQEYAPAIPVDSIEEHPRNFNFGDVGAISESMDEHGFYGAVLVHRSTRFILAGNHRYRTAKIKGATTIPGFWLDCDEDTALRILAVDNRTTHLATFDEEALVKLLASVATTNRGLAGTGYSGEDLQDLVQQLNPPDLSKLGGGGGGADGKDLWPVLRFKVPPEVRDRWYQATDPAEDQTDEGRFYWALELLEKPRDPQT